MVGMVADHEALWDVTGDVQHHAILVGGGIGVAPLYPLAQALREGKMGFMDYYKLENLKGDTAMREGISKMTAKDVKGLLHE